MMNAREWREFRDKQRGINSIEYRGTHGYYPTPTRFNPVVKEEETSNGYIMIHGVKISSRYSGVKVKL